MAEADAKCPYGIEIAMRDDWLMDLVWATERFEEPLNDELINLTVEATCRRLRQQHDVLVLAIEYLECYRRHLIHVEQASCNEDLAILLSVWVANKMVGGQEMPILLSDVEAYRAKFLAPSTETVDEVKAMELAIVKASMHKLRPASLMDDVRLVAFCLTGAFDIGSLVVDRCQLVYMFTRMCWREVHYELAQTYGDRIEMMEELLGRRVAVAICVFLAVVKMSRNLEEATRMAVSCGELCQIHARHLMNLAGIIAHVAKIRLALRKGKPQQSVAG